MVLRPKDLPDDRESPQLSNPVGVEAGVSTIALGRQILRSTAAAGSEPLMANGAVSGAPSPDTQLMLQVKAGSDSAFNLLVEKFRRPMVGFMYRMARNQAVAEELAQEVFLRVYRSRQTYAAEAKFTTWLYRIATNLALNHLRDTRQERAEASVSLDEPDQETGRTPDVADPGLSAEQQLLRRERLTAIRHHVEALPERQRAAVI